MPSEALGRGESHKWGFPFYANSNSSINPNLSVIGEHLLATNITNIDNNSFFSFFLDIFPQMLYNICKASNFTTRKGHISK